MVIAMDFFTLYDADNGKVYKYTRGDNGYTAPDVYATFKSRAELIDLINTLGTDEAFKEYILNKLKSKDGLNANN